MMMTTATIVTTTREDDEGGDDGCDFADGDVSDDMVDDDKVRRGCFEEEGSTAPGGGRVS